MTATVPSVNWVVYDLYRRFGLRCLFCQAMFPGEAALRDLMDHFATRHGRVV